MKTETIAVETSAGVNAAQLAAELQQLYPGTSIALICDEARRVKEVQLDVSDTTVLDEKAVRDIVKAHVPQPLPPRVTLHDLAARLSVVEGEILKLKGEK
jgi:hypothetical protein